MRIRRLLAAYRRDDWSPDDLAALTRHLSTCVDCRQIEASFRTVGESIRQLPSITPPPPPAGESGDLARITLRLPEPLKEQVELAATAEGVSVNAWLVRAITAALYGGPQRPPVPPMPPMPPAPPRSPRGQRGRRITGFAQS